jgi:hypothetical protein
MADESRPIGKLSKRQTCTQGPPKQTILPKKLSTNTLTTVRYPKNIWAGNQPDNPLAEPKHRLEIKGNTGF